MSDYTPEMYVKLDISVTEQAAFSMVQQVFGDITRKELLDYGCGTGRTTAFLQGLGARPIGTDVQRAMIEKARKQHPDLSFEHLDDLLSSGRTFGGALATFVHLEAKTIEELLAIDRNVYRLLKPGAVYVIMTDNPESAGIQYRSVGSKIIKRIQRGVLVQNTFTEHPITFHDTMWFKETHENILTEAGFRNVHVTYPQTTGEPSDVPPFMIITAVK